MEIPQLKNIFFMVFSVLIYGTHGLPVEDNASALTPVQKLVDANNIFSIKLHQNLADNSGRNIFFSPTSLFFALGMLYRGANGETAKELRHILGYSEAGFSNEDVDNSFNQLLTEVFTSSDNFTLKTANAILVDRQLNLRSDYKTSLVNSYHANVLDVNFQTERNQVMAKINQWISDQTDGKIPEFLEHLDPSVVMMILNAVYFKGLWSTPFETRGTKKERFYNYGGERKSKLVSMMHSSHRMLYSSSPNWQMVELPYKGDRVSMVIILPKERNGLAAVEKNLTSDQIRTYRNKMRLSTVHLTLPKFKIDSSNNLNNALFSLGLKKMFQNDADFSGIVQNGPVRVSEVMQKAMVEVDEKGTIAAAASGVFIIPLSLSVPHDFKADHPFFFATVDKKTDLILFSGRVIAL